MNTVITINKPGSSPISIEADTNLSVMHILSEIMLMFNFEKNLIMMDDKVFKDLKVIHVSGAIQQMLSEKSKLFICVCCENEFIPASNNQKICFECRDQINRLAAQHKKEREYLTSISTNNYNVHNK